MGLGQRALFFTAFLCNGDRSLLPKKRECDSPTQATIQGSTRKEAPGAGSGENAGVNPARAGASAGNATGGPGHYQGDLRGRGLKHQPGQGTNSRGGRREG